MYGKNYQRSGGTRGPLRVADIPVTWSLIGVSVATFLIGFFTMRASISPLEPLVFSHNFLRYPWALLTWPLVSSVDLFGVIFTSLWAFWVCGSLERAWGAKRFLAFFFATAALTGLTTWGGARLLGVPFFALYGLGTAVAAPTIAWCHINRRETIVFNFLFPIPAPVLAWLTAAFTWFSVSTSGHHPLLGLFALSGCAAARWWITGGALPMRRPKADPKSNIRFADFDREMREGASRNPLTRWKEEKQRRERDKKLEEMFKRSGFDDNDRNG